MSAPGAGFSVATVDDADALAAAYAVRSTVFVGEQQVPPALERDALDTLSRHVIARDADGRAIGTGRLGPDGRIGRLAVLAGWRGRGVGDALLRALLELADAAALRTTTLHAQLAAMDLYARHGFVAHGPVFDEAGIAHRAMRRVDGAGFAVDDLDAAIDVSVTLVQSARRHLWLRSRDLDPGLFDRPEVLRAFRRFATAGRGGVVQVLLQDASAPQREHAPLLALAQRLPSAFAFRAVDDAVDRSFAGAFLVNDNGGFLVRALGHRFDGEAATRQPGQARQLAMQFAPVWERSRPCTEFRALGI
ncbi:GNAT family N-acetyltransferase [Luteimonas sp. BDR2-5]|uniref:GNAT family N-acetyltransferase n=1 Tax=Proluteimonas luteida TaxID=2878685 RepID=UPI001E46DD76|nr:GNAT family N-acetyltransferase [Luteimonas sp. BDR2-5]MCD9028673.1 GNAT family N-acetyltransferase [Luteimonas sp. BDR2-5]